MRVWRPPTVSGVLWGISMVLVLASIYLAFLWAPNELTMGQVYRVFFIHVPVSWVAFVAFFVVFISSILYLWKRSTRWDILAQSAAEIGVLLTTLSLVTGSIWGKPTWGVWWTWDPRLTSTLLLWMIYVGYLMVRNYASEGQAPRFAAVVGILGFVDVPIVYYSVEWWQNIHPNAVIRQGDLNLSWEMFVTVMVASVAFTILFVALLRQRVALKQMAQELALMKRAYLEGLPLAEVTPEVSVAQERG
jgi:heme exporter protein C